MDNLLGSSQFFLIPCSSPDFSNANQPVALRSDTKSNTKCKELIRTDSNCYELQGTTTNSYWQYGCFKQFETSVSAWRTVENHEIFLEN